MQRDGELVYKAFPDLAVPIAAAIVLRTRYMLSASATRVRAFPRHAPLLARLMVVLVALFYGWVAYANVVSTSHDPVSWPEHESAPLVAQYDNHGHTHDEPGTDEHDAGHQHGHNAADHSHDKLNLPRSGAYAAAKSQDVWSAVSQVRVHPGPYFPFERPPRTIPIL